MIISPMRSNGRSLLSSVAICFATGALMHEGRADSSSMPPNEAGRLEALLQLMLDPPENPLSFSGIFGGSGTFSCRGPSQCHLTTSGFSDPGWQWLKMANVEMRPATPPAPRIYFYNIYIQEDVCVDAKQLLSLGRILDKHRLVYSAVNSHFWSPQSKEEFVENVLMRNKRQSTVVEIHQKYMDRRQNYSEFQMPPLLTMKFDGICLQFIGGRILRD